MTVTCGECEKSFTRDNFHADKNRASGLRKFCKKCSNERDYRNRYIRKVLNGLGGDLVYVEKRERKSVPFQQSCVIKRLGKIVTSQQDRQVRGKFIESYDSYLLFKRTSGIKECFRKNDIGIDWDVIK